MSEQRPLDHVQRTNAFLEGYIELCKKHSAGLFINSSDIDASLDVMALTNSGLEKYVAMLQSNIEKAS